MDARAFITGFVLHKTNFKSLEAGLESQKKLLECRKRLLTCFRMPLSPALPGEHEWRTAGAATAAGACVDPHWGVLQSPQYCLLTTKAFYHDQHDQVKAHSIKPGVGESRSVSGMVGTDSRGGIPRC